MYLCPITCNNQHVNQQNHQQICYIVVRVIDMGNLIRKTKAAISCKEKSTTVVSDVKNDPKKDTAIFVQVSSEELKKRRIDLYPYLI